MKHTIKVLFLGIPEHEQRGGNGVKSLGGSIGPMPIPTRVLLVKTSKGFYLGTPKCKFKGGKGDKGPKKVGDHSSMPPHIPISG